MADSSSTTVQALLERWPALAGSKQPPALPSQEGPSFYDPGAAFGVIREAVVAGTYRLRAPCADIEGLIGPFRNHGDCLSPLLHEHLLWIDPHMEPEDNDLVIVALDPIELQGIIERGRDKPEWVEQYGEHPGPIATKLLKCDGGAWWLQDRESAFPLTHGLTQALGMSVELPQELLAQLPAGIRELMSPKQNRILGVVRKVMTFEGRALYEDAPVSRAIQANAVTTSVHASAGTVTLPSASPGGTAVSVSITTTGEPVLVTAMSAHNIPSSVGYAALLYRDSTSVGGWGGAAGTASPASITVVDTPAAGTHTYSFVIEPNSGSYASLYASIQAVELKR